MNKNKKAFTLIELLVVIAIIAILAAILFPVFAQAKEAAKKTQCLSNTKQIGMATMLYVENYDDTLFQQFWPGGCPKEETGYFTDCMTELGIPCQPDHYGVLLMPYMKSRGLLDCPSNSDPNYIASFSVWQCGDPTKTLIIDKADYQINEVLFGDYTNMSKVDQPANIGLYSDGRYIFSWRVCVADSTGTGRLLFPRGGWDWTYLGPSYHGSGSNFSYGDGHSKYTKASNLPTNHPSYQAGISDGYYNVLMASEPCDPTQP